MMQSTRTSRRVFSLGLCTIPVFAFGATPVDAQSRDMVAMMAAIVDLIIPRDATPSASDIGVHHRILEAAKEIPNYPQLLAEGLGFIERNAQIGFNASFLELATGAQTEIMAAGFEAPPLSLPFVFADRIRADTLKQYYQDARSWTGMGFDQPIQPMGYPDFQAAPA